MGDYTDMTFSVPDQSRSAKRGGRDGGRTKHPERSTIDNRPVADTEVLQSSRLMGIGMRSHAGVAATAFQALADKAINIRAITTSEIKISILIDGDYAELAVRTLHGVYGLDKA